MVNRTIMETRFYECWYIIYPPADPTFCTYAVPEDSLNVLGSGTCVVSMDTMPTEHVLVLAHLKRMAVSTSSFRRDASRVVLEKPCPLMLTPDILPLMILPRPTPFRIPIPNASPTRMQNTDPRGQLIARILELIVESRLFPYIES